MWGILAHCHLACWCLGSKHCHHISKPDIHCLELYGTGFWLLAEEYKLPVSYQHWRMTQNTNSCFDFTKAILNIADWNNYDCDVLLKFLPENDAHFYCRFYHAVPGALFHEHGLIHWHAEVILTHWGLMRSWSTLVQVMARCLTAPSHYLNQCWLIIDEGPWHSSQGIILRQYEDTNQ